MTPQQTVRPPEQSRSASATASHWLAWARGKLTSARSALGLDPQLTGRGPLSGLTGHQAVGLALLAGGVLLGIWLAAGWWVGSSASFAFFPWHLLGFGAPLLVLALVGGGVALAAEDRPGWRAPWQAIASGCLLFVCFLLLAHLVVREPAAAAAQGEGGGLAGLGLSGLLSGLLTRPLAWIIAIAGAAAAGAWLWRSLPGSWTGPVNRAVSGTLRGMSLQPAASEQVPPPLRPARKSRAVAPQEPVAPAPRSRTDAPVRPSPGATSKPAQTPTEAAPASPRKKPRPASLPPMDLLNPGDDRVPGGNADARQQAQIIRQTLAEFGVPVEVVSIKEGPTVTQFGLEPGEIVRELGDGEAQRRRVSVNRILRLSNDLALALSATSIRIEAPVPGRPYVGVEIPNPRKTLVSLRSVLESKDFVRSGAPLAVALGRDVAGDPVVADLTRMPHLLIAGATGSGKSVCINALVTSLLMNNGPESLRFLMIDPKMVELPIYNNIPHLIAPVVTDTNQATGALAWLTLQMDERYRTFAQAGVRNIVEYNRARGRLRGREPLPYLVLVIDELADLMMVAGYDIERQICRLAQMARATGIHLALATQRPSVDVITGLIKANFPARIAFAVATQIDSRVILDGPGAEKLLGRGDMLFMAPESAKLVRVQGCYVSDREIDRLVDYWKNNRASEDTSDPEVFPWAGLLQRMEDRDDLLDRALEMLRGKQQVSTSLLQRQLRLGYPRAARLMEQLEAIGAVGPDEGGGRSRVVLLDSAQQSSIE